MPRPRSIELHLANDRKLSFEAPTWAPFHCATAGNRQLSADSRAAIARNHMGLLISAALGYPIRYPRSEIHKDPEKWGWMVYVLERLTGRRIGSEKGG